MFYFSDYIFITQEYLENNIDYVEWINPKS